MRKEDAKLFEEFLQFKRRKNGKRAKQPALSKNGKKLGRPPGRSVQRRGVYKNEFEKFIDALYKDKKITTGRKIWTEKAAFLLYHGGFRISEVVGLFCEDICTLVKKGYIDLRNNTKTKSPRVVYFSSSARKRAQKIFKNEIEFCGEKFVIHGRHGSYDMASVSSVTSQLNELLKKYLEGQYTTHSFRQAVITQIIIKHGTKKAQAFIGHKSLATTLQYQEIVEEDIKYVAEDIRGDKK